MKTIKRLFETHPRLMSWLILAIAMLIILVAATWNVSLQPLQRVAMAGATIVLAGLCVWIIYWE